MQEEEKDAQTPPDEVAQPTDAYKYSELERVMQRLKEETE